MEANQTAELLKAWSALISAIGWPLVVVFVLLFFGPQLRTFLQNLGELRFKVGATGVEASITKQQAEAAAYLGAATAQRSTDAAAGSPTEQAQGIARVVTESVRPASTKQLANSTVLWVDDRPNNNVYERMSLEALGIQFVISTSTDDAVAKLRAGRYDLVISDMGRPPDPRAGYTLLAEIRDKLKLTVPFLIYAGSNLPEHDAEARQSGASGSTGNPRDLFRRVVAILERGG
jgi:CheY-like chemotaxis protein/Sec-independent protein translocase protein TatA